MIATTEGTPPNKAKQLITLLGFMIVIYLLSVLVVMGIPVPSSNG